MRRTLLTMLLLGAALPLAGCGGEAPEGSETAEREADAPGAEATTIDLDAAPPPAPPPADETRVAIGDVLGQFGGTVHALTVWEHPDTPYLGAVIAANGPAGLSIVPVDREVPPRTVEGVFDGGVAVGYLADGTSLLAASSGDEVVVYDLGTDGVPTELSRIEGSAEEICMSGPLVALLGDPLRITQAPNGRLVLTPPDVDVAACTSGADTVSLFGTDGAQSVLESFSGTQVRRTELTSAQAPAAQDRAAIFGGGTATAQIEAERQVLIHAPGTAQLVVTWDEGRAEGSAGAVSLRQGNVADDAPIRLVAAGSGNFGGVYRDGVVAVLDMENRLKLIPWSSLARAVGAPVESTSLRPAPPEAEDAGFTPRPPALSLPVPADASPR